MAIKTSALVPFNITSIPDRLTAIYIANKTQVTAATGSGGSTAAAVRLNRLQSATFGEDTNVMEVVEMGAQFRPGGVDELGEAKVKLDWNAVGINNIAAITGVTVGTAPGSTTTVGLTNLQSATVDLFRMVADVNNNVFKTTYCQDVVIDDWTFDIKDKGMGVEGISGRGPNMSDFPGFVVPAVYVANGTDVTNGYLSIAGIFGPNEQAVAVYQPGSTSPSSYWQENGANYFLKIEKVPGAILTNSPVRYFEFINATQPAATAAASVWITPSKFIPQLSGTGAVGSKVILGLGTANKEVCTITAVASQVNTNSGSSTAAVGASTITPASMAGIQVGVTLTCANANGSNSEVVQVTAITGTTFTATFTSIKAAGFLITSVAPSFQVTATLTHAASDILCPNLTPAVNGQGTATFVFATNRLYTGDTLVNGDAYRFVFNTYNTDSFPLSIPTNSPDTADRPGISYRLIPVSINAGSLNRAKSFSMKFSLKRDHVNGVGEKSIIYGVPSVPDVAISLDLNETDASLLSQLATGSKALTSTTGTIQNDNQEISYITRSNLKTAIPVAVKVYDPYNAGTVLASYSAPQFVVKNVEYASSNKSDNTVKISGLDITGNMSVTYVVPS